MHLSKFDFVVKGLLPILVALVSYFAWTALQSTCSGANNELECLYGGKLSIYQPLYFGGKWLTVILLAMTVVPWRIYRYWALTLLPAVLVASYFIISNISVYSSGVTSISRAQMAVNSAMVLAVLSGLFVAGFLLFELYKKRRQELSV